MERADVDGDQTPHVEGERGKRRIELGAAPTHEGMGLAADVERLAAVQDVEDVPVEVEDVDRFTSAANAF